MLISRIVTTIAIAAVITLAGCGRSSIDHSVVQVKVFDQRGSLLAVGSGFQVADGYVMTSRHVLPLDLPPSDAVIRVYARGVASGHKANTAHVSETNDLALLRVKGLGLSSIILNTGKLQPGERVEAIGFPAVADVVVVAGGTAPFATRTEGSISRFEKRDRGNLLEHSAQLSPGSSGGPLVDACGYVVGSNNQRVVSLERRDPRRPPKVAGVTYQAVSASDMKRELDGWGIDSASRAGCQTTWQPAWLGPVLLFAAAAATSAASFAYIRRRNKRAGYSGPPITVATDRNVVKPKRSEDRESMGRFFLVGSSGAHRSKAISLSERWVHSTGGIIVGRSAGTSRVRLDVNTVSRDHARLRVSRTARTERLLIEDLGSRNGTYLDGVKLKPQEPCEAVSGSEIRFGDANFTLVTAFDAGNWTVQPTSQNDRFILTGNNPDTGEVIAIAIDRARLARKGFVLIGRSAATCDFVISDSTISRDGHVRIFASADGLAVVDAGSTNGVRVDGQPLAAEKHALLTSVSLLELGKISLRVERQA